MAKSSDLMGLGMSAKLADMLGRNPASVTCAGTASGTATAITTKLSNLVTDTSKTGAILPAVGVAGTQLGDIFIVNTTTATSAVVYPPTGATINAGSSLTVAVNQTAIFVYYSPTVIFSILTA